MASVLPLLLEIGTEELPSSFVDAALAALPGIVADELANARLSHGAVQALGTPRRLAVLVRDVAARQLDLDEEAIGPPETAAFKDGKPTRAAEAFAAKLGLSVDALTVVDKPAGPKQKPGRYVIGRRVETGRPAMELLGAVLPRVCAAIPFRKSMRWGDLDATFGRPVQWLVALLGEEIVPVELRRRQERPRVARPSLPRACGVRRQEPGGVRRAASRAPRPRRSRRARSRDARARRCGGAGGGRRVRSGADARRRERVARRGAPRRHRVVRPRVSGPARGGHSFGGAGAPEVLLHPALGHVRGSSESGSGEDELLPSYLAVVNTANRPDLIAKGTDRVMRARLSDARFFWQEDQKMPLESRGDKLGGIVFHHRLGTVRDKVDRIAVLSDRIAETLGQSPERRSAIGRAARLCKCDLVTLMVGEFPELQGHMGRAYALAEGEPREVADAIRDHYRPLGAQDDVAPDDVSAAIALADRLDTLAGCFAVGLAPTGAADPFALRRACIGALRTLLDRGYAKLSFAEMIGASYDGLAAAKLDLERSVVVAKLEEFAVERLRGLVASATTTAVADAVLTADGPGALRNVVATMARARALKAVVDAREPWLDKARIVAKRLAGISREATPKLHAVGAFRGSPKNDDLAIEGLVRELNSATENLGTEKGVRDALMSMERVALELDRIFIETLVNDPADAFTAVRLETLAHGARSMLRIADFSRLA